ncbi:phosphodiester glycosidase family protein [Ornithinimicrobium cavernae]|uniref:phosphodiester glycosidase family protein n=1 Tax=Ornithinimicrobium cavernae TaxID=2666047 RepID=UPI000D69B3B0|nr:phosphodiester glycosidase family protein [Ornithinimicrobium cavernae]
MRSLTSVSARPSSRRRILGLALAGALSTGALVAAPVLSPTAPGTSPAAASEAFPESGLVSVTQTGQATVGAGLVHTSYDIVTGAGAARANMFTVDLEVAEAGIITAPYVASSQRLDDMAEAAGTIAAMNGDFFQISNEGAHGDIPVTQSASGAEVRDGEMRKTAVPVAQRYGGGMPKEYNDGNQVVGQLRNGTAVVTRVEMRGFIATDTHGKIDVDALNQYGMERDQIGAYDGSWGRVSRERAACGSEDRRRDPCTGDVTEVIVTDGVVTSVSPTIGSGQLGKNQIAVIGREAGAATLAQLQVGEGVGSNFKPVSPAGNLDWAIAGGILVQDGVLAPSAGGSAAARVSAGVSTDGTTLFLIAVDGGQPESSGITIRDLGDVTRHLGADDVMLLDGGGSTTMLARDSYDADFELLSKSRVAGIEVLRYIPNGIGIWTD